MEKVLTEKKIVEKYKYIAKDGKVFYDEKSCELYEAHLDELGYIDHLKNCKTHWNERSVEWFLCKEDIDLTRALNYFMYLNRAKYYNFDFDKKVSYPDWFGMYVDCDDCPTVHVISLKEERKNVEDMLDILDDIERSVNEEF